MLKPKDGPYHIMLLKGLKGFCYGLGWPNDEEPSTAGLSVTLHKEQVLLVKDIDKEAAATLVPITYDASAVFKSVTNKSYSRRVSISSYKISAQTSIEVTYNKFKEGDNFQVVGPPEPMD